MATTKLFSVVSRMNLTRKWMPDKLNMTYSARLETVCFERKNRKKEIHIAFYYLYLTRPPSPQLRTDVIDNFQTATMKRPGQTKIEFGPVDEDDGVGFSFNCRSFECLKSCEKLGKNASYLNDSHNREII